MRDVERYSRSYLESRTKIIQRVKKYNSVDHSYGMTHVEWSYGANVNGYIFALPSALIVEAIDIFYYHAYFDTDSGELLGTTRNDAAVAANRKALTLTSQGRFSQAKKYFNMAFQACVFKSTHESSYQNSRDAVKIAMEAQNHMDRGEFEQAAQIFQAAYDKSNVATVYKELKDQRDRAETKAEKERIVERVMAEWRQAEKLKDEKRKAEKLAELKRQAERLEEEKRRAERLAKKMRREAIERSRRVTLIWKRVKENLAIRREARRQKLRQNWHTVINDVVKMNKEARQLFENGQKLWEDAWAAEDAGKADEAESKFLEARRIFEECQKFVTEAADKYLELTRLKIQGNEECNRGMELQLEAAQETDAMETISRCEEASLRFQKALQGFTEGLQKGERKFESSKLFVEECLQALEKMQAEELQQALGTLSFAKSAKKPTIGSIGQQLEEHKLETFSLS